MTENRGEEHNSGNQENQRAAVAIQTQLSSYLISAALAVLAAEVVVLTFVGEKRVAGLPFVIFSGLSVIAVVGSIFVGGKGIAEAYKAGFHGRWREKSSWGQFGWQTILALVGVATVALSLLFTAQLPSPAEWADLGTVSELQRELRQTQERVVALESAIVKGEAALQMLRQEVQGAASKRTAAARKRAPTVK